MRICAEGRRWVHTKIIMTYKVIALKHRPQNFSEIIAQEHITLTLKNAVAFGKIHHGYLFSGPRGTGKTTTARVLSKALNCENPTDGEPCSICNSCLEIASGNSPDVIEIDAASNRGIDDIRDLREAIRYTPIRSKYKIYIIDEVHQLTSEAFNALLKTLEEPPKHGIFIMATTEPQKVPATIMSRCLKFDFRLIPLPKLINAVKSICDKEGVVLDEEGMELICTKASGSLRDALSLLDQVIASSDEKINSEKVSEILGLVDKKVLLEISISISRSKPLEVIKLFRTFINSGGNIEYFLESLNKHFRDLLVIKLDNDGQYLGEIAGDYLEGYREALKNLDEGKLLRMLNISAELFAGFRRKTIEPIISIELALIKMANLEKTIDLEKLLKMEYSNANIAADFKEPDIFDFPQKAQQPTSIPNNHPELKIIPKEESIKGKIPIKIDRNDWGSVLSGWKLVVEEMSKKRKTLWALLNGAIPKALDNNTLTLKVTNSGIPNLINTPNNIKALNLLTEKIFGTPIRLEFNFDSKSDALTEKSNPEKQNKPMFAGPTGDKIIDSALKKFGGHLVDWKPKDKEGN